ncbi:unnamed protein product [Durusdinium trenchii]|uniref:Uncharacterized protein n=1 Tax=Durusdinium trenchii TaxID=1381693 RepID=A0ABP0JUC0_9DINO
MMVSPGGPFRFSESVRVAAIERGTQGRTAARTTLACFAERRMATGARGGKNRDIPQRKLHVNTGHKRNQGKQTLTMRKQQGKFEIEVCVWPAAHCSTCTQ